LKVFTAPDDGYASVSTVNLTFAGYSANNLLAGGISSSSFLTLVAPYLSFDGMNEKGVCITLLADIGIRNGNTDILQWSAVYNLTHLNGYIFAHRNMDNVLEFYIE